MGNALTTASLTNLPSVAVDLTEYAGENSFLPRIQLMTFVTGHVKDGNIEAGHYGVPRGEGDVQDLGTEIDLLPLAVRNKALDTTLDPPLAVYDAQTEEYQRIKALSGEKDSGCMFGPSFLVLERNTGELFELFLGNKSGRQEAGKMAPYLPVSEDQAKAFGVEVKEPTPFTLRNKVVSRPRQSWHVPVVGKCSTPFNSLPDLERISAEVGRFVQAKQDGPEAAKEATSGRTR